MLFTLATLPCSEIPAWKQLIAQSLTTDECISLITTIFSDPNQAKTIELVPEDHTQNLIDMIDKESLRAPLWWAR